MNKSSLQIESKSKASLIGLSLGIALGIACTYPDTFWAPVLVLFVLTSLWAILENNKSTSLLFYVMGIGFHSSAMWWLMPTVSRFGGFPMWIAFFILALHTLSASLQFLFTSFLTRYLKKYVRLSNAFMISWMLFELLFPRLFPWGLGNFFVSWTEFTALSEVIGERGLSFLVLLISLLAYKSIHGALKNTYKSALWLGVSVCLTYFCGRALNQNLSEQISISEKGSALLIQGNLSTKVKGDMSYLSANLDTYRDLTRLEIEKNPEVDFIVWPETVFNTWSPFMLNGSYVDERFDPYPTFTKPLIYGALGYNKYGPGEKDVNLYNSAFLRSDRGEIAGAYAKRVLMPFGEYVPFSETFPFLLDIVQLGGAFSVGPVSEPMQLEQGKVGVLICYEDLVSDLAREYNKKGANLLLNVTNDAWYGDSPASRQHDLLARFRALETRTYLLRSTNTGFTSVIDPFGRVVASLDQFTEGVLKADFYYINHGEGTIYSRYGAVIVYVLIFLVAVHGLLTGRRGVRGG